MSRTPGEEIALQWQKEIVKRRIRQDGLYATLWDVVLDNVFPLHFLSFFIFVFDLYASCLLYLLYVYLQLDCKS